MRKLIVFNQVTLDGYFSGVNGDLNWAHGNNDVEWKEFVAENARSGGMLLFGRVTYEMMASYWPTDEAQKNDAVIAERMNALPKVVFSRTLKQPDWSNTTVVPGEIAAEVRKLKSGDGKHMTILGSGSIVSQLTEAGLIDEYQLVMNPVVLGAGKTMFDGLPSSVALTPTRSRIFGNGNVLLCYERRADEAKRAVA